MFKKLSFYLVILSMLIIIIVYSGIVFYRNFVESEKTQARNNLSTLARLKIDQMNNWREERMGDGAYIQSNTIFTKKLHTLINQPENRAVQNDIAEWLRPIQNNHEYLDIIVFSPDYKPISLYKHKYVLNHRDSIYLPICQRDKKIILAGLHKDVLTGQITLGTYVPLFSDGQKKVFGLLKILIDPTKHLFPTIQAVSLNSKTAETFVVRREGDSVTFLNNLRFRKNAALSFKLPITRIETPAVMAVKGKTGIVEGIDYNGNRVLADLRPVPDSPWFIVSKINLDELYAPARKQSLIIFTGMLLLIVTCGLVLYSAWKNQYIKLLNSQLELRKEKDYAEESLKRSEERFRKMFEEHTAVMLIIDPGTGQILDANPAAVNFYGYPYKTLTSMSIHEINQLSPEEVSKEMKNAAEKKLNHHIFPHKISGGEIRTVEVYSSPLRVENNRLLFSIIQDVTQRKTAEQSLLENQARLIEAQKLAHIGNFKFTYHKDDIMVYWSDEVFRIYEKDSGQNPSFDEVLGCIHSDDVNSFKNKLELTREQKSVIETEYRIILKGKIKYLHIIMNPVSDGEGRVCDITGTIMDITERKLAQLQLEETLDELQRSNEDLEHFAYSASHDLQEPIRMVKSYAQLFRMKYYDKLDEDARTYLSFMSEGASRMETLISGLLRYSRISTQKYEIESVDCNKIVQETLDDLSIKIKEEDARIEIGELPEIQCNPTLLRQLFQNLIHNALKFRSEQKPEIKINCQPRNEFWLFAVQDNGIGIDPAYYDKIFVIFQRLHNRDRYPGTGIGLAICKKIIERHGGQICVDSAPGKGTTFYFTVPIS